VSIMCKSVRDEFNKQYYALYMDFYQWLLIYVIL
jgi:hypothetical protein